MKEDSRIKLVCFGSRISDIFVVSYFARNGAKPRRGGVTKPRHTRSTN